MTTKRKLGVGVIGVGLMGKTHATNLAVSVPNATLIGIADVNQALAESVAKELGVANAYSDYQKLLGNADVEAVVIATPSYTKPELIATVLDAGKHIFCEKPLSVSLEDADEIVRSVERTGITFQMGFQRRFDPSLMEARHAIQSGQLGRILMITSKTRDPPGSIAAWEDDPKLSGGIFNDTCSHDFDIIRWLTGGEVKRVFAVGRATMQENRRRVGNYDTVLVTLELTSDALGHVDSCSHTLYGYDTRVEVIGTEADILTSVGMKTECQILSKNTISNNYSESYFQRFAQAYRDEIIDFANSALGRGLPRSTAKDGRAAVEIGLAAVKSAREATPVPLAGDG